MTMTTNEILDELDHAAWDNKPRLFAIYGYDNVSDGLGDQHFIGWGMEFTTLGEAILVYPNAGGTHHSGSAEQILNRYKRTSAAHLIYFDDDE